MTIDEIKKRSLTDEDELNDKNEERLLKKQKKDKKHKDKKHKKENKETEQTKVEKDSHKDKKDKKDKKEKKDKKDKKDKKNKKNKDHIKDKKDDIETEKENDLKTNNENIKNSIPEGDSFLKSNNVTEEEKSNYFKENQIKVEDPKNNLLNPILDISTLNIDSRIFKHISKFPKLTPIQALSWPYLFKRRDVIGVAETGSGKTLAFGVPGILHALKFPSSSNNNRIKYPRVAIISPTRELAVQIYENLDTIAKSVNISSVCIYGGVSKDDQREKLRHSEVVVATPGRLNDLISEGAADLSKVDFLVLDEADRMLEKGFEEDIRKIISSTQQKNRQTLMFTATWPESVRKLAREFTDSPVKINIGDRDELKANTSIEQVVEVINPDQKEGRFLSILQDFTRKHKNDKIIIFALYKKEAMRYERLLQHRGFRISALHGDLSQAQRTSALSDFKSGRTTILLATDVAARGLDIPSVKLVINLTFPLTVEDYVHRIGRTGRAGQKGKAITLFTEHEKPLSGALINVLKAANQPVPDELLKFGTHTKKKEHSAYGAFFKDVDPTQKAKKIKFD